MEGWKSGSSQKEGGKSRSSQKVGRKEGSSQELLFRHRSSLVLTLMRRFPRLSHGGDGGKGGRLLCGAVFDLKEGRKDGGSE
jgi:hypothetical protein